MKDPLQKHLRKLKEHLDHIHSGKVRESFLLNNQYRLVIATDRVSIFDFVLGFLIESKGEVLTAMNIFWRLFLAQEFGSSFEHDLVAYGPAIDEYLPRALRGNPELWKRAIVVSSLEMLKVEAIVRGNLVGSGWDQYAATGHVCGQQLPPGLRKGERLVTPIYTPTTKAVVGHDEPMSVEEADERFGTDVGRASLLYFGAMRPRAAKSDLLLMDKKVEFGRWPNGRLVLGDEVGTPDSSRYVDAREFEDKWPASMPESLVKEFQRVYGRKMHINEYDPKSKQDREWVSAITFPTEIIDSTRARYHLVFEQLIRSDLATYQRDVMGIK